jgi:hypothetical protein
VTVTQSQFTANFPEFADADVYPATAFTFWYGIAGQLLDEDRWGTLLDVGAQLYVAHNLVLEARAQAQAAFGAVPGETTGPISGKTVDKVSATYAVAEAIEEGGGQFNLTTYGTRFFGLVLMMGSGGMQL